MDAKKHLLSDLFGLGRVAQHPVGEAEDPVLIRDHQFLEGPGIARPQPIQQTCIARRLLHPLDRSVAQEFRSPMVRRGAGDVRHRRRQSLPGARSHWQMLPTSV